MTTTSRQTTPMYPWNRWGTLVEVKPPEWAWCFNLREGKPEVLEQEFEHKRDSEGVSQSRKAVSPPRNSQNWPRLNFNQVVAIYDKSLADDISLRKSFLLIADRKKLSEEQIEVLADAPDLYVEGLKPVELEQKEAKRREKALAFLAEVDGPKAEAPKLRQAVKV